MDPQQVHLQRMIEMLQGNLNTYEEQSAAFGELYVPPFLKRQIEETRKELEQAKERLSELQVQENAQRRPTVSVPQNLPPRIDLIGRTKEIARILRTLRSANRSLLLTGMAGIGKTALVKTVAHQIWEAQDYQAVIWLSSEDRSLMLNTVIDTLGYVLDYQYLMRIPAAEKPSAALDILRTNSTLLIVDGLEKIEDSKVEWFLNRIPVQSKFIAVSNKQSHIFDEANTLDLRGLNVDESVQLILREAERLHIPGVHRVPQELLVQLHHATSGNPYALKLSTAQLRAGLSLEGIIDRLKAARSRVFEDIYVNIWDILTPDARQLLKAMTVFGGSVSQAALEHVTQVQGWTFEDSMAQLVKMSLMDTNQEFQQEKIRYSILPLTRSFAANILSESPEEVETFHNSAAQYIEDYCQKRRSNFADLQMEMDNIKAIVRWSAEQQPKRHVRLAQLLYSFYRDCGYWEEALWHLETAFELANTMEGLSNERAWLLCQQASIYIRRGSEEELQRAEEALSIAEGLFSEAENEAGICAVRGRQARVAQKQGQLERAVSIGQAAMKIAIRLGLTSRIADLEHELGDTYRLLEELDLAEKHYERSLEIFQQLNNDVRITGRFNDLGKIAQRKGEWHRAEELYEGSVALARKLNKRDTLCRALIGLAQVEEQLGQEMESFKHAEEALTIAERLGARFEAQEGQRVSRRMRKLLQDNRVVIFDFDNTLVDSTALHIEAWNFTARHFGYDLSSVDVKSIVEKGLGSEVAADELGIDPRHKAEVIQLKRSLFRDDAFTQLDLFPEVPEVVNLLIEKGLILAIASMNTEVLIQEVLHRSGLVNAFTEIIGQESISRKQPDPQILELLLERIPVPKMNFLFVGDALNDYESARCAGVQFVACARGEGGQSSKDKFGKNVRKISDLKALIEMLSHV